MFPCDQHYSYVLSSHVWQENSNEEISSSPVSPPFSHISDLQNDLWLTCYDDLDLGDEEADEEICSPPYSPISNISDDELSGLMYSHSESSDEEPDESPESVNTPIQHADWHGYKLIGQLQYHHLLTERQRAQLVWSRFVNTHGRPGCNIPADLHMEHLNRRLKIALRHIAANVCPSTIVRAAKSIGTINRICEVFERETRHRNKSDSH